MVVNSLLAKLRNKFNVSAIEAGEQDLHQTIVLAANPAQADGILDHVMTFVEANTEAEIVSAGRAFR